MIFFASFCILAHVVVAYGILQVLQCCDESTRVSCLKQHHSSHQLNARSLHLREHSAITLVSYDTADILDYALYAFAINSVYARHHSYGIYTTSSAGGFEFEKRDQRWNKVKIVHSIIKDLIGRNITDQYIVWMDSDLIVLDLELNLLEIAHSNPLADIIVSQDVEPLNGMINTGCMLIRSSTWALTFLEEWWNTTDRIDGMDQHVFDLVYKRRLCAQTVHESSRSHNTLMEDMEDIKIKLAILAPHALNSHIPARIHQEADHKVLHLAGESSVVRTHIFKLAFAEICRTSTPVAHADDTIAGSHHNVDSAGHSRQSSVLGYHLNVSALAPQLGIARQVLAGADYATLLTQEVRNILSSMHSCDGGKRNYDVDLSVDPGDSDETSWSCDFHSIVKLRARLRDAMQSRDLAAPAAETNSLSNTAAADTLTQLHIQGLLWALQAHQIAYEQLFIVPNTHYTAPTELMDGIHHAQTPETTSAGTTTVSKQEQLDHLQAIVDAAFEVCVRNGVSHSTLHKTLTAVAPVINKILAEFVGPDSLGPALYYKFKYFDLQAGYYKSLLQHDKEYESLRFAHETWLKMSQRVFYGTGNTVADPYKEIAVILARLAELECGGELSMTQVHSSNMRELGLKHVLQSVNYTVTAWLPKPAALVLLQLSDKAYITASNDIVQQKMSSIVASSALAGVSSKVLHILSDNYLIAHTCVAADTTDVSHTQVSVRGTESSAVVTHKFALIASHLCALLAVRGEVCAADVMAQLDAVVGLSAPVSGGASTGWSGDTSSGDDKMSLQEQSVLEGTTAAKDNDSKRRVKLKRKKP